MTTSNKDLISRTLAKRMMSCIEEYRAIKNKTSSRFKTVSEFCKYHQFSHQNFMKILHRYEQNPCEYSLVPQKRGPKFKTRRTDISIEEKVIELRKKGVNRYEIRNILLNSGIKVAPSPTTIYNICKRNGLNKLRKQEKEAKRRYLMSKIGELVHIDLHQLPKGITIAEPSVTYYLLGVIDDLSRTCWVEVMPDKKALTVMFATPFVTLTDPSVFLLLSVNVTMPSFTLLFNASLTVALSVNFWPTKPLAEVTVVLVLICATFNVAVLFTVNLSAVLYVTDTFIGFVFCGV